MRILVLGGTAMLGREIAHYAVSRGHETTCLARGESGAPPAGVRWVSADRAAHDGLSVVTSQEWDVVIDVSRQPGHVRRAVGELASCAGHYVFVSSGNVYADHSRIPADESTPTLAPLVADHADAQHYGAGKVACEKAVLSAFGDNRALIARAGLIGGPGDWSGRSGYWPWRFRHPATDDGAVLVPDDPELPMAIIDVRDLATWLVDAGCGGVRGTFDAFGEPQTLGGLLAIAREASEHSGSVVAASPEWLADHDVAAWMGPDSLPLWLDDQDWRGFSARPAVAARAAGLTTRPLTETLAAAYDYELRRPLDEPRACGLSDETERRLISALRHA